MSVFGYNNMLSSLYNYPYQALNNISNPLLNYIYFYPAVFIDKPQITDNEYIYTIEMAGISKDNVSVTIEDDEVIIIECNNKVYRTYNLPEDGDENNVIAKMKCGLLKIIVPKLYKNSTKTIKIQ